MSWNVLENEVWYDPSSWNWNPQCQPTLPFMNVTNGTNITQASALCTDYCDFNYPLYWDIDQIRTLVYPIFMYIFGVIYTFFAIAIICDEFFVPALERISEKYGISPDVAGATLMAAGGSAPELATSFVGTFSDSPVGFGTIVGSAVFNVLFVIGACAFASPEPLALDWWPLFRDCSYYSFALLITAIFFGYTSPSRIFWYEALILFGLYICYVLMMSQNAKLQSLAEGCAAKCKRKKRNNPDAAVHPDPNEACSEAAVHPEPAAATNSEEATVQGNSTADGGDDDAHSDDDDDDDDDDDEGPFEIIWPSAETFKDQTRPVCKLYAARIMFIVSLPLKALFYFTIPDVRREDSMVCGCLVKWKELWLPGFVLSIFWIAAFSYLMVWWAEVLGEVSTVPSPIVGLTLLAAGTSIPDLVSSLVVARKGEGNMAVSSSIGSNIFDILICLPVPWLLYSIINGVSSLGHCTESGDDNFCFSLRVYADTLLFSVLLLIVMILCVILIVHCSHWKMTKGLGVTMLGLYIVFVTQDILRNCDLVEPTARWFTWLRSNNGI